MEELFTCPICFEIFKDPVACTECSGTMCLSCRVSDKNNINYDEKRECAICRTQATCKPSRETVRFLDTLKFYCAHRKNGCDVKSVYSNLVAHVSACK